MLTVPTKAFALLIPPGDLIVSARITAHHTRNKSVLPTVARSKTCVSSKKRFVKHVETTPTTIQEAAEVSKICNEWFAEFN